MVAGSRANRLIRQAVGRGRAKAQSAAGPRPAGGLIKQAAERGRAKRAGVAKGSKPIVNRLKDSISRRTNKADPRSRTGSGGATRARNIDTYVERANTGRRKKR